LYEYYLVPGGGYFGTKKAMEPLHVQYDYANHAVAVVNDTYSAHKGMKVTAKIYNLDGKELASHEEKVDVPADSSVNAFDLPKADGLTMTFFAKLQMFDVAGKLVSDNFYWLSAKEDTLDWRHRRDTVYTPQAEFGDFTGLEGLPTAVVSVERVYERHEHSAVVIVTVKNRSNVVAFMTHLRLVDTKGSDVAPVFWNENYFSLLPHEEKEVWATYDTDGLAGQDPTVLCDGWNVTNVVRVPVKVKKKTGEN